MNEQIDWPALILKADAASDPERALATLANMASCRDREGEDDEKLLIAQRDEAKAEADRLYKAGKYLAAALRFYTPSPERSDYRVDPYYKDAHVALAAWEKATEEGNYG